MNEPTRAELLNEWMAAKKAHQDFAGHYVVVETVQHGQDLKRGKPLTSEAIEQLHRLDQAEKEARDKYDSAS